MAKTKRRRCGFCRELLPEDARPNRKFCDEDCRRGRVKPTPLPGPEAHLGPVATATEEAIKKARDEKRLGVMDAGALAAIRVLARKIDEEQERWDYCLEWAEYSRGEDNGPPPKPPPMDNVSIPTFLRYCESLGLTPAGRGRIPGGTPKEAGGGSTLGSLTGRVPRPA